MIKAAGRTGLGVPLLVLGLDGENVTRLAAGEPIRVATAHLAQLGLPATMDIVILYGRTEADILETIEGHGITIRPGSLPPG
jgi:hypothetical protein